MAISNARLQNGIFNGMGKWRSGGQPAATRHSLFCPVTFGRSIGFLLDHSASVLCLYCSL